MRRSRLVLIVLACVLLSGCALSADVPRADPTGDPLGWEDGYWYDDRLDIETGDGLNASERAAVVARSRARIEHLRGLEFEENVSVTVISRAAYRANRSLSNTTSTHARWNDQVWEGLFLVGEDARFGSVMDSTMGASVLGYYSPSREAIVIVSDAPTPTISRSTLVHELVHALQDQHFGLRGNRSTQDEQLAVAGLIEGEATLLQRRYAARCGDEWDCPSLQVDSDGSDVTVGAQQSPYRQGVFTVIYQPYASGVEFVRSVQMERGWTGVDELHGDPPISTEQVIHPERYPDDHPVSVAVPDRSGATWSRFDHDPVADTVGEASIYAMFAVNGVTNGPGSLYSYVADPSNGWAGDTLVPYRSNDEAYGYVWQLAWDTPADAREFEAAYRQLLRGRNATAQGDGVFTLPSGDPFADAFRLSQSGTRVTIVNGPKLRALQEIHAAS